MSSILLIGDIVGYGNLGMSVMTPILSHLGYEIYRLPSSMVSNNFSYGKFAVLDTTDYMRQCIDIWEEQGFNVDAVCTGYLVSEEQTRIVTDYCRKLKARGTFIFVDPIMADDGKLYNGATDETVAYMRSVCKVADLIVPNVTEAKFLADKYLDKDDLTSDEAECSNRSSAQDRRDGPPPRWCSKSASVPFGNRSDWWRGHTDASTCPPNKRLVAH